MLTLILLPDLNLAGGTPRKVLMLARCQPRPEIAVIARNTRFDDARAHFEAAGVPVFYPKSGSLWSCLSLIRRLRQDRGVTGLHCFFFFGFVVGAIAKLFMADLRVTAGLVSDLVQSGSRGRVESWALAKMDGLVYVSDFVRKAYQASYPRLTAVPGAVIYNAAEARMASTEGPASTGGPLLLAVSGLNEHKNIGFLVDVAQSLSERLAGGFRVVVIGDGPERSAIQARIDALGLGERMSLLGYREDVGDFLRMGQIFLHPATNEGFGIAVLEAMQAGLPVLAADRGGLPELVADGETGYLLSPDDSESWASRVEALVKSDSLREKLGGAGAKRARECFSMASYCDAYHELLNGQAADSASK